jgi:propionate CoA-transferase
VAVGLAFDNFEGMTIRSSADVESVRRVFGALCTRIGRKVATIVDYDGFKLDEAVGDKYFGMVGELQARHYMTATRSTTSAFLRAKLDEAPGTRHGAAHVFEIHAEAVGFLTGGSVS